MGNREKRARGAVGDGPLGPLSCLVGPAGMERRHDKLDLELDLNRAVLRRDKCEATLKFKNGLNMLVALHEQLGAGELLERSFGGSLQPQFGALALGISLRAPAEALECVGQSVSRTRLQPNRETVRQDRTAEPLDVGMTGLLHVQ